MTDTIQIEMYYGCYSDCHGLPPGWTVSICDLDEGIDNHDENDLQTVRITIENGCVTDVENLPDGYSYDVIDEDDDDGEAEED